MEIARSFFGHLRRVPDMSDGSVVLVNGRTLQDDGSRAPFSMGVKAGMIEWIHRGASARANGSAYVRDSEVLDLGGRLALPGFVDAHAHVLKMGAVNLAIDLRGGRYPSVASIADAVAAATKHVAPGDWIRGRGYDQKRLAEGRHPLRVDLDAAAPRNPVLLTRACGHVAAFNTLAMEMAGIQDMEPDPPEGWFDRSDGRLTGVAFEAAQRSLQIAARLSSREIDESLTLAQAQYFAAGCTTVHDMGGLLGLGAAVAQKKCLDGSWKLRTIITGTVGAVEQEGLALVETGLLTGFGTGTIRVGPFKLVLDGSSSAPTCATRSPYASQKAFSGLLYHDVEQAKTLLERALDLGYQITVHAVGDRAIEIALSVLEAPRDQSLVRNIRHRIEHCAMLPPDLQDRVVATGVIPVMQPAFIWEYGDGYLDDFGPERGGAMFPLRSLLRRGVTVAGSSDAPVADHRPLFGMRQAVTRLTRSGRTCGADERVSLWDAIQMYTTGGAAAAGNADEIGSLDVGKCADIVVLDDDPFAADPDRIADIPVWMTVRAGEVVHQL